MATITGLTAARMIAIEAASVISGVVDGNNLILTKFNGTTINAGNVRGPQGVQGVPGSITTSPAGGALAGNYPDPSLADSAVTAAKVASANKDGNASTHSMRTLGTGGTQASAGNHSHTALADTGWIDFTAESGDAPFGAAMSTVTRAQYRKVGSLVHVRITKYSGPSEYDRRENNFGNYPNSLIMGLNSIPVTARPESMAVNGSGRWDDSSITVQLTPEGSVRLTGGAPRNYQGATILFADFVFLK